jgi:hypothetical protein
MPQIPPLQQFRQLGDIGRDPPSADRDKRHEIATVLW